MFSRNIKLIILLILLLISAVYLGVNFTSKNEPIDVSLKWKHQAQFAGMYSAKEKGFYSRKGMDVTLNEFDFMTDPVAELISDNSQFSIMSAEVFLNAASQGVPIQAVAAIYQVSPYALASLSDMDITTPADLENKVLGNKGGSLESLMFYKQLLYKAGLNLTSAEIKDSDFSSTEHEDLLTRKVDVIGLYRTDQLYVFEKFNTGYNLIKPERFGVNIYNDVLVTTNELIEQNPKLVKDFVSATIKGWYFAIDNRSQALEHTAKYITEDSYMDDTYQAYILDNSIPLIKPDSSSVIGRMSSLKWEEIYSVLSSQNNSELVNNINISEFVTNEFLPKNNYSK